ncbi:coproporphyrinogen dehydrogenase HemZ [Zongyangia hominis]|uniref:Coproporphyrinogen dehydrogenase HemZ n=1 Tax=Zongyangia hominis TaxID=2763677 RepID=A0A926EB52_9FIRM|nr:coproporphyrinogen dehydrogenase HemZ [Zongyangia hominis]MBC8569813.1 coproporphyrinogen dehydrogenase HemZ [Zongyangia hominis]
MTLIFDGHSYRYELESLCRFFFTGETVTSVFRGTPEDSGDYEAYILTSLRRGEGGTTLTVRARYRGREEQAQDKVPNGVRDYDHDCEYAFGVLLYRALSALTGVFPQWGVLTGIRPVKLFRRLLDEGKSPEEARKYFEEQYLVTPEKSALAACIAENQRRILSLSGEKSYSLYLSMPFCPSRCRYCSFVSHNIEKTKRLVPDYLRLMCEEIRAAGRQARELGLRLASIYFGGGTPTAVTAPQLRQILDAVAESFPVSDALEYTVEAGRPDTIDRDKLRVMKEAGVTRISINPQTLQDEVLRAIGRNHTAAQTVEAFHLAREMGFDDINMDLIAGLPGDTLAGFRDTLSKVMALGPENVTVHTLTVKRSSDMGGEYASLYKATEEEVSAMVDHARQRLMDGGWQPYYLYRQKNTIANLENVGYAKSGHESDYNIFIMEEVHTILAVGAGAVTKLVAPTGKIERIYNYKYPYEYIDRFDQMMERKNRVVSFYEHNGLK